MNSSRAKISRVYPFSVVDGPGARLAIFLQGCQFRCAICHNPHTQGICDDCGLCVPACPRGALRLESGRMEFRADLCDHCDACLRACPIDANPMAQDMSVDDLLALIRRYRPFLEGVTVSGGEPTMQLKFLAWVGQGMRETPELQGLTLFVDSNGHLPESGWRALAPHFDAAMIDVKALDPALHRRLTGFDNARPLASARWLKWAGKLYELRAPLIPGVTDTDAALDALAGFVRELGADQRLRLNAFQRHGVKGEAANWPAMTRERLEAAAARLRGQGLENVATPSVYLG